MGSLTSVASALIGPAALVSHGLDAYKTEKKQDLELQQLQQKQKANMQIDQQKAAQEKAAIEAGSAAADAERRLALQKAVAEQKAQFSAQGLSASGGGSTGAVLLGLNAESDQQRQARAESDTLRKAAIDQELRDQKKLNVIQRSQLKEQQSLARQSVWY